MIVQWADAAKMQLGSFLSPNIEFMVECDADNLLKKKKDENLPDDELSSYHDIAVLKLPDDQGLKRNIEKILAETDSACKLTPKMIEEYKKLWHLDG